MSTKIYYGLRFPISNVGDIPAFIKTVEETVTPILQEAHDKRVALDIFRSIDAIATGSATPFELDEDESLFMSIGKKLMDRAKAMEAWTRLREPIDDFTFELSIYFTESHLLLMPICEQKGVYEALLEIPGIEPYGYWNNTDPDEDVSEKDWEQRRQDWNKIIDSNVNALVLRFNQNRFVPGAIGRSLQYIPDLEDRIRRISTDLLLNERMVGVEQDQFMRIFMGYGKWLKTNEGKKALQEKIEVIGPRLTTGNITMEVLEGTPKTFINPSIA